MCAHIPDTPIMTFLTSILKECSRHGVNAVVFLGKNNSTFEQFKQLCEQSSPLAKTHLTMMLARNVVAAKMKHGAKDFGFVLLAEH